MERFEPLLNNKRQILIAGPCSYEGPEMFNRTAAFIKHLNQQAQLINVIRGPFNKPRTNGGHDAWYGLGKSIIPHALETAEKYGLIYATEVQTYNHVLDVCQAMEKSGVNRVFFWTGARNTSSGTLMDIGNAIAENSDNAFLMVKNSLQWDREISSELSGHIVNSDLPMDRVLLCHRGFNTKGLPMEMQKVLNPSEWRNVPDHNWALATKEETGLPMIFDPSHTFGNAEKVLHEAVNYFSLPYDGYILETHPNPAAAKTDKGQQLSFDQLENWLQSYYENARVMA